MWVEDFSVSQAVPADNIGTAKTTWEKKPLGIRTDTLDWSVSSDGIADINKFYAHKFALEAYWVEHIGTHDSCPLPPEYNLAGMQSFVSMKHGVLNIKVADHFLIKFPYSTGNTVMTGAVFSRPWWKWSDDFVNLVVQQFCEWFTDTLGVRVHISRGDICGDFQGLEELLSWSGFELRRKGVKRARRVDHEVDEQSDDTAYVSPAVTEYGTGFVIGKGDVQFRFYDKFAEMTTHQKENYYHEVWQANGYEFGPVQRGEFQLRRPFFKQWRVKETGEMCDTIQDFAAQKQVIWRYLTHDWLRFVDLASATRKTRCKTLDVWKIVQDCVPSQDAFTGIRVHNSEPKTEAGKHKKERVLKRMIFGCVAKYHALKDGSACPDPAYYHGSLSDILKEVEDERQETIYQRVKDVALAIQAA